MRRLIVRWLLSEIRAQIDAGTLPVELRFGEPLSPSERAEFKRHIDGRVRRRLEAVRIEELEGDPDKLVGPSGKTSNVPTMALHTMGRHGIYWDEAQNMTDKELLALPNFGKTSLKYIRSLSREQAEKAGWG